MEYKIGDKYSFPTSQGFETEFEGKIIRITDKAIEFSSRSVRCVNHGHPACNISAICWLPKSIIEKNYIEYNNVYSTHYVIPPFWINIEPTYKHEFHNKKERKSNETNTK